MDLGLIKDIVSPDIIMLVVAGAFLPAAVTVVVRILALPGLRNVVGGVCLAAGKATSLFLTRWLKGAGEKLEDAVQEFLVFALNRFYEGLDTDDKANKMKVEIRTS